MSKYMTVLFIGLLMVACATTHHSNEPPATPVVKAKTCTKDKPCGYPHGCYCLPVGNGHVGMLVDSRGLIDMKDRVRCMPSKKDLARPDSYCQETRQGYSFCVKNGRLGNTRCNIHLKPTKCSPDYKNY